jgi:hypothetical protein
LDNQDWEKRVLVRLPDITVGVRRDKPKRTKIVAEAPASEQKNTKSIWILATFYGLLGLALAEIAYIGKVYLGPRCNQSSISNEDNIKNADSGLSISPYSSLPVTQVNPTDNQIPIELPNRDHPTSKHQIFRDPIIGNKFRDALLTSQQNRTQQNQPSESKENKNVASQPNRVFH